MAVGSYNSGLQAGGIPKIFIFKTSGQSGWIQILTKRHNGLQPLFYAIIYMDGHCNNKIPSHELTQ